LAYNFLYSKSLGGFGWGNADVRQCTWSWGLDDPAGDRIVQNLWVLGAPQQPTPSPPSASAAAGSTTRFTRLEASLYSPRDVRNLKSIASFFSEGDDWMHSEASYPTTNLAALPPTDVTLGFSTMWYGVAVRGCQRQKLRGGDPLLVAAGSNNTVRIFKPGEDQAFPTTKGIRLKGFKRTGNAVAVDCTPGEDSIVAAFDSGETIVWAVDDVAQDRLAQPRIRINQENVEGEGGPTSISVGTTQVAIALPRSVAFVDVRTGQRPGMLSHAHEKDITGVAWNRLQVHSVLTCSDDATVKLWDVRAL
ncbi:hypothetical protein HK405_014850, partial [Cladochytrium tenue]